MKVGDPVLFMPDCWVNGQRSETILACSGPIKGKIVYIHPRCRYYVAEGELNGRIIREAFKIIPNF